MCEYACVRKRKKFLNEYISVLPELSGEVPLWNLVTSSLDRNLINLRCACGTCAETKKKRARLHERTAMLELGLVMYSLCFTKRGRPVLFCHC